MDAGKRPHMAYCFDCFTLDLARGVLLAPDGAELTLRPKSFAVLQLFVENAGRLLDRDAIMQAVWPDVFVTDDSIAQCVHDIRRVLGDAARGLLRTVPRRGYLFTAEVSAGPPARPLGSGPRPTGQDGVPEQPARTPLPAAAADAEPPGLPGQNPLPGSKPESLPAECLPASEQIAAIGLSSSPRAERRHLSVLVCDLVGSTTLAEQLDPEDLGSIIHTYRELCSATIAQCGGHVASYTSDGLLAFFGYPNALEDAAERSVLAGLSVVEAAANMHPGPELALQVRVGIATGLMVISDLTGERTQGRGAVGMPLNMAVQLQTVAEAGSVIISNSTRCLVGGLFALEDLGCHPLKGFTAPVRAWRVTGQGAAESRFEALRGAGLTPLVGRGQEVTLLLDRWEHAKAGEGQAILLAGEPGIGKSRLIQAVRDQLNSEPHVYVGCYCSPHSRDNPLRPVIAHLERAANFASNDDPATKIAKLETLLAQANEDITQAAPLIASLLSIPADGRYPPHNMSPQLQREQTLAALVEQLARLALRRPLLLVWEDVHWADPTSMELLGLMIDRLQNLGVLALVTFRTEFLPPWPRHTHTTWLTLNRLGRHQCSRLITGLSGGKPLPATVLDQIAAKADGMPLFVEELTKAVLESGLLREADDRYELDGELPPPAIPATLQDLLMARLDRQPSVKEIAQVAAVIGREFSHELLARVISLDDRLTDGLRCLIAAELIFGRGMAPHAAYVFKHALVRDAAYASLLKSQRRNLHARIATVLEGHFAQIVKAEPDMLAHHWTEAGQAEKAVIYRLNAGEHALARSATTEAVAQLMAADDILQSLPDGSMRHHRELDLRIALGAALSAAKGQAAPETVQAYARAHELCGKLGEEQRLFPVLLGLWSSHNARDELGAARTVAAQLLHLGEQNQNGAARLLGHRALGATSERVNDFETPGGLI